MPFGTLGAQVGAIWFDEAVLVMPDGLVAVAAVVDAVEALDAEPTVVCRDSVDEAAAAGGNAVSALLACVSHADFSGGHRDG